MVLARLLSLILAVAAGAEDGVYETKAGDARVMTSVSAGQLAANAFLLPLALAFNMPHYGFERRPYDDSAGYGRGERDWAGAVRFAGQALAGGRGGGHAEMQVRGANRLGWQAAWDGYATGSLRPQARADEWSGHITANYVQSGNALLELGLGVSSLNSKGTRTGPSAALFLELFPRAPLALRGRYQAALLRGQSYHHVSAAAGFSLYGTGLYAGYSAYLGPAGNAHGPEAGLSIWF